MFRYLVVSVILEPDFHVRMLIAMASFWLYLSFFCSSCSCEEQHRLFFRCYHPYKFSAISEYASVTKTVTLPRSMEPDSMQGLVPPKRDTALKKKNPYELGKRALGEHCELLWKQHVPGKADFHLLAWAAWGTPLLRLTHLRTGFIDRLLPEGYLGKVKCPWAYRAPGCTKLIVRWLSLVKFTSYRGRHRFILQAKQPRRQKTTASFTSKFEWETRMQISTLKNRLGRVELFWVIELFFPLSSFDWGRAKQLVNIMPRTICIGRVRMLFLFLRNRYRAPRLRFASSR